MNETDCNNYKLKDVPDNWEVKQLGEIGECLIGLTYKPENVKESGLLVLRSSNIGAGRLKVIIQTPS